NCPSRLWWRLTKTSWRLPSPKDSPSKIPTPTDTDKSWMPTSNARLKCELEERSTSGCGLVLFLSEPATRARLAPSCWVRFGEGTKHPLGDVILGAGLRFCDFFWRVLLLCESPRYSNRKI